MKYSLLFLGVLAWTTAHTATANPPCPSTVWVQDDWEWANNWAQDDDGQYRVRYTDPNDANSVPQMYTLADPNSLHYATMPHNNPLENSAAFWKHEGACTPPPCAPHEVVQGDGTCVPCAAGKENPNYGATCTDCAPGKFKAFADATACQNCPAGQENNAANTGCQPCSTGEYSVVGGVCLANGVFDDGIALKNAFLECLGEKATGTGAGCDADSTHGAIGTWDVSRVTSMSSIFSGARAFDQDISSWDVGKVTNMFMMFYNAKAFDQDISSWDVSQVTTMNSMFYDASAFDQDLSSWNVGRVTLMSHMFNRAYAFNQDLSSWNVGEVNAMNSMFNSAYAFDQDLSSWNVGRVTTMNSMFNRAYAFNQALCGQAWVDSTATKDAMFYDSGTTEQDAIGDTPCPTCFNTGGIVPNDGTCTCGGAACTPGTGLYCTASSSSCHSIDLCANTDGTTENTENCQCGSSICTAGTGRWCFNNKCSPFDVCANTVGAAENTGICRCGNSVCSDVTGHFCTSAEHKCSRCSGNQEKVDDYCLPTERGDLIEALIDAYGDDVKEKYNTKGQC